MGAIWSRPPPTPPPLPPPAPLLPPPVPAPRQPAFLQSVRKLLAQTTPGGALVTEKLAKILGSYLPVVLALGPSVYMLYSGNIKTVGIYFSEASMYVGMGNSFAWLLYNTMLMRESPAIHEVLANGLVLIANFQNLMIICTANGRKERGYITGGFLCAGLLLVFALLIWAPSSLPAVVTVIFGIFGIFTSLASHVTQMVDIVQSPSDKTTRVCSAVNLAPTLTFNLASFIITKGWHSEDEVTQVVSLIGIICNVVEMFMLLIYRGPDMNTPRDATNGHVAIRIPEGEKEANEGDKNRKNVTANGPGGAFHTPAPPYAFGTPGHLYTFPPFSSAAPTSGAPASWPSTRKRKSSQKRPKTDPPLPKTDPPHKTPVETADAAEPLCSGRPLWRRLFSSAKKKASA